MESDLSWIYCEDYLPPLGRKVFVWSAHDEDRTVGGVMIAYRRPTDGQWCNSRGQLLSSLEDYEHWPSHWQPLPRSPFATNK